MKGSLCQGGQIFLKAIKVISLNIFNQKVIAFWKYSAH